MRTGFDITETSTHKQSDDENSILIYTNLLILALKAKRLVSGNKVAKGIKCRELS